MSNLYPDGHKGGYILDLKEDKTYMSLTKLHCHVCSEAFKTVRIREVKLIPVKTDRFMRVTYKDIEPLYYEVASCPKCRYTAQTAIFNNLLTSRKKLIQEALLPYLPHLLPVTEDLPDAAEVFERFYLAMICAEAGFSDHQMITAGLWLKLSRIYADCGDEDMETYAAKQAQQKYIEAYQALRLQPIKYPPLALLIGSLSYKIGDIQTARGFLLKVKTDINSTPHQKGQADDFIYEIRLEQESKAKA